MIFTYWLYGSWLSRQIYKQAIIELDYDFLNLWSGNVLL